MLHLHSGLYHVLMTCANFGKEVKLLKSSGREFQMLVSSVHRLFLPNVVVFALKVTNSFFLLSECEPFLKYMYIKSRFMDFKVLKTLFANLFKWLTSMVGNSPFNSKLL